MNSEQQVFGEVVEVYTTTALLQLQRQVVQRKQKPLHTVDLTLAPILNGNIDFTKKLVVRFEEQHLATFCQCLMGLRRKCRFDGKRVKGEAAKVVYVNVNDDDTININACDSDNQRHGDSNRFNQYIVFKPEYRYQLLALAASQLTKNSQGYEQTVGDTLNLLKASAMHLRTR